MLNLHLIMDARARLFRLLYILLILLLLTATVGFLVYYFNNIFLYLLIAAVLSLMGRPLVKLLRKVRIRNYKIPDSICALLTLLAVYGLFALLFSLMVPVVVEQTQAFAGIDVEVIAESLKEPISSMEQFMHTYNLGAEDQSIETYFQEKILSLVNSTQISSLVNDIIGFTGDVFIAVFSVSFISFFFLKETAMLHSIILTITPSGYEDKVDKILSSLKRLLTRYFIGVVIEVLLVGSLIGIGLSILGVKNAMTIGFFAGIFNVIPYLGPIIGATLGITFTILSSLQLDFYSAMVPLILKVTVVFAIVQMIDNFVFQPFIYSSSVRAHPLEIFLVILMAANLAGVGGMIVAIPVYTIMRAVAKEFFNQFKVVQSLTRGI